MPTAGEVKVTVTIGDVQVQSLPKPGERHPLACDDCGQTDCGGMCPPRRRPPARTEATGEVTGRIENEHGVPRQVAIEAGKDVVELATQMAAASGQSVEEVTRSLLAAANDVRNHNVDARANLATHRTLAKIASQKINTATGTDEPKRPISLEDEE